MVKSVLDIDWNYHAIDGQTLALINESLNFDNGKMLTSWFKDQTSDNEKDLSGKFAYHMKSLKQVGVDSHKLYFG